MLNKLTGWDDTIVALSTAPGLAAIAVIRLSGMNAITIVNDLFPSRDLLKVDANSLHVGLLQNKNVDIDEVVVSVFKAPRSYTGEDVIEISCHGSPYIQERVLEACINNGARMARAGEFTQRAFLNGKLDLAQAESVADLINSNTSASQKTALNNVRGGFSTILKELRENLVTFSALIELELDFSEEDVEFADREKFLDILQQARRVTARLIGSFQLGNVIRNGISVAIIGKPNAGKSTLLNTLLNEERAIVSDIAGTTRDTIEELLNINGVLFRLIDTAGIRLHTTDVIEAIGVERSLEKMKAADIVLYIFDGNEMPVNELSLITADLEQKGIKYLLIANKADHSNPAMLHEKFKSFSPVIFISAKAQQGIEALTTTLYDQMVGSPLNSEDTIITNQRQQEALRKIHEGLEQIENGMRTALPGDLLALDLRHCLQYISEITGDITSDTVLDYVFSKFCIGK